jgi:hypothetical protein
MLLGNSTTDLDIQNLDQWNLKAKCCTEDYGDLYHIGGTVGDCNSHCVFLSGEDMVLTVEIKNESFSSRVYSVALELCSNDDDETVEIQPPEYSCEPILNDESDQFMFRISSNTSEKDDVQDIGNPHRSIIFRVVVKYGCDEKSYPDNKMDTDIQLHPSAKV